MKKLIPFLILLIAVSAFCKNKPTVRWPIEHHRLSLIFDVDEHSIEGTAELTLPPVKLFSKGIGVAGFLLNKEFQVQETTVGSVPLIFRKSETIRPDDISPRYGIFNKWDASNAILWTAEIPKKALKAKPLILEIAFSGSLYVQPSEIKFSREKIAFEVDGTIGPEGIFLSSGSYWYPTLPDVLSTFEVKTRLPDGWNCVTDGQPGTVKQGDGWIEVVHRSEVVSDGISMSAAPWIVEKSEFDGVEIITYFLPEQADLAEGYHSSCRSFLDMYSQLIAPYPFTKFAVVDNFLATGYGMPGWTLIGSMVLSRPEIRFKEISLGHEIVHNWFGNSLFVDYREGNWCEGLTVYYADYKYKEDADSTAARDYRMDILSKFTDYVTPENDYPVVEFIARATPADRAIGYGKVMMIFHMLRKILNQYDETIFWQVVSEVYSEYQWQPVGWEVWREEFERRLGQKLDWFFNQWIYNTGALDLAIENVDIRAERGRWKANFEVTTKYASDSPVQYLLPIRALSNTGQVEYKAFISEKRQGIQLSGSGEILTIQLDPDFDLFRRVYPAEVPLTLAKFFGDSEGILVVPSKGMYAATFRQIADNLKSHGQRVMTDLELTEEMLNQSLWLFGDPDINSAMQKFPPDPTRLQFLPYRAKRWIEEDPAPAGIIYRQKEYRGGKLNATMILQHPNNEEKSIVYSLTLPEADLTGSLRKVPHYGKYSYLLFDGDNNIDKDVWTVYGDSPVAWRNTKIGEK
ncbi:hypothetical protein HQ587_07460 [bacterium]|nr:hypothetical protein [bacterium]